MSKNCTFPKQSNIKFWIRWKCIYVIKWIEGWNEILSDREKKYNKVENHKNKRIQDEVAKCHSSLKTEVPTTFILSTSYYTLWFMLDEMHPAYHLRYC